MEGNSFKLSLTELLEIMVLLGATEVRVVYQVTTSHQTDQDTDPSQFPSAVTEESRPSLVLKNPSFVLVLVLGTPVNKSSRQY